MTSTPGTPGNRPFDHAEFDVLLPAPGDPQLSPARQTLLKEHLMDEIQRTAPAPRRSFSLPRTRRARIAWFALPMATAVAAGAVALGPMGLGHSSDKGVQAGRAFTSADAVAPTVVTLTPGTTEGLSAAADHIALAAAKQTPLAPGKNQYLYVESKVSFLQSEESDGEQKNWIPPLHQRQIWLSPDGTKGYIYEPDNGTVVNFDDSSNDKRHSYEGMKALPTDPDALLKRLYQGGKPGDPEGDWGAFKELGDMLHEQLAPPEVSAALYRVAAKIPGVQYVDKAADAGGREGIAIAFVNGDIRHEWIFDKNSYAYLGQRQVLVKEAYGMKPGTVIGQTTVVERAVVDAKKELPDGRKL
ncbi:CU044_5270 family protein [Streptomyces sp. NPDC002537]